MYACVLFARLWADSVLQQGEYRTRSFISRCIHKIRAISRSGLDSQKSGVTNHVQILQDNTFWYMFHCPVHLIATLLPLKKNVHTSFLSIWFHPLSSIYQGISSSGLHSFLSSSSTQALPSLHMMPLLIKVCNWIPTVPIPGASPKV